jgi:hypothetical protein
MLQKNVGLSNVAIDLPQGQRTSSNLIQTSQATNSKRVLGHKQPLPPCHRAREGLRQAVYSARNQNVSSGDHIEAI